ncbi:hypothetical protein PYCC9005_003281 [Savitreella phatthalungensis]
MRQPMRESLASTGGPPTAAQVKISSPLIHGGTSLDSNESDPIDITEDGAYYKDRRVQNSYDAPHLSSTSFSLPSPRLGPVGARSFNRRLSFGRSMGSFVGSYEESLLSGRMSQSLSRPLDFTASIGVLGTGKCKTSLRCPPHLTIEFPASFYSDVSPYVGQIDLDSVVTRRGYRIPPQGQLQIIIKNPNKTAVKFFLVPYDVADMPPLHKTFFRQKHYEDDKMRYAIHVQICCTAEGKHYLYRTQRVVFANRVPDGREKLRIVTQQPEPQKYTPWVPEKKVRGTAQDPSHQRPDAKEARFIGGSLLESYVQECPLTEHALAEVTSGMNSLVTTNSSRSMAQVSGISAGLAAQRRPAAGAQSPILPPGSNRRASAHFGLSLLQKTPPITRIDEESDLLLPAPSHRFKLDGAADDA